jgi:hypothetical protein
MDEYAVLRYDYSIALMHTAFVWQQDCLVHPYCYLGVHSPVFTQALLHAHTEEYSFSLFV